MKKLFYILVLPLILTSCLIVDTTPGPNGLDGRAYFGVDYDVRPPYSYWDNNNSIPFNPVLGEYYGTFPGVYEFEYFINEDDYWFGTYEVRINRGGIGGANGEHGFDGLDTYFMLIADPDGYHVHFNKGADESQPVTIERKDGKYNYTITLQKGSRLERKAQNPKYIHQP